MRSAILGAVVAGLVVLAPPALGKTLQTVVAPPPSEHPPSDDEGVLAVSFTVNTSAVGQFDTLVLRREGDTEANAPGATYEYSISEITGRVARDTSLFLGVLKAGDYTILRLNDPDRQMTFYPGKEEKLLGSFHVAPGKLTDLGRIVITPLNEKVGAGRSQRVKSNARLLDEFAPSARKFYREVLADGWSTHPAVDEIEQFALRHPIGVSKLIELPDGRVAAPTRLGSILLRDTNGKWRALQSGSLDSWLSGAPGTDPDTLLVAVGEYSNIAKVDRDGVFHMMPRGNLPMGTLIFVAGDTRRGWVVALRAGPKISLYRSDSLEAPDWQLLYADTLTYNTWTGVQQQLWLWPTAAGFAYARNSGDIRFYALAGREWTDRSSPGHKPIINIQPSPGGKLGLLTSPGAGFGGISAAAWFSTDDAKTWVKTGSPYNVKVTPPKFTTSGLMLESGGVFGGAALHGSRDDGKTWTKLSDKVALMDVVYPMPTTGLFKLADSSFIPGVGVEILSHSADDGATWVTEYTSYDRLLAAAQASAAREKAAATAK